MCVCACVRACVRACVCVVHACMCTYVHACMHYHRIVPNLEAHNFHSFQGFVANLEKYAPRKGKPWACHGYQESLNCENYFHEILYKNILEKCASEI